MPKDKLKISIITPVRNEANNLKRYFLGIESIDYPKNCYELIVVDSNSSDNTVGKLKEYLDKANFNNTLVPITSDVGKAVTRKTGAEAAQYENLLFLDCKCNIYPDVLQKLNEVNYQPLSAHVIQDATDGSSKNLYDRLFYLGRQRVYKTKISKKNKNFYINKSNFDKVPKGTTMFYCDKKLFLDSQIDNITDKDNSDDTKLLWNIVQKKEIIVDERIKVKYFTRDGFWENIEHMYGRGPRFVDYYYTPSKAHFWIINLTIIAVAAIIYVLVTGNSRIELLVALLGLNAIFSLFLSKKFSDFFLVFILWPIFFLTFLLGIIKGLIKLPFKK
jgi:glycosyltransferase involved in cell wall biosynthesis